MASGGEFRNVVKSTFKFRRIPDKWKDYAGCGKPIPGERLISFKTPLAEEYHCNNDSNEDCLQKGEEFTPTDLCEAIQKCGSKLGLVVDFTNTKRYYDPKVLKNHGIEYQKIKCEGKIVPPERVVTKFKASILSFFRRFPTCNSLVGVHCTHGLNRTGYIVCRYLIDCKGYAPEDAIKVFSEARGYDMERENYIDDLKKRKPSSLSDVEVEHLLKDEISPKHRTDTSRSRSQNENVDGRPERRRPSYNRDYDHSSAGRNSRYDLRNNRYDRDMRNDRIHEQDTRNNRSDHEHSWRRRDYYRSDNYRENEREFSDRASYWQSRGDTVTDIGVYEEDWGWRRDYRGWRNEECERRAWYEEDIEDQPRYFNTGRRSGRQRSEYYYDNQ